MNKLLSALKNFVLKVIDMLKKILLPSGGDKQEFSCWVIDNDLNSYSGLKIYTEDSTNKKYIIIPSPKEDISENKKFIGYVPIQAMLSSDNMNVISMVRVLSELYKPIQFNSVFYIDDYYSDSTIFYGLLTLYTNNCEPQNAQRLFIPISAEDFSKFEESGTYDFQVSEINTFIESKNKACIFSDNYIVPANTAIDTSKPIDLDFSGMYSDYLSTVCLNLYDKCIFFNAYRAFPFAYNIRNGYNSVITLNEMDYELYEGIDSLGGRSLSTTSNAPVLLSNEKLYVNFQKTNVNPDRNTYRVVCKLISDTNNDILTFGQLPNSELTNCDSMSIVQNDTSISFDSYNYSPYVQPSLEYGCDLATNFLIEYRIEDFVSTGVQNQYKAVPYEIISVIPHPSDISSVPPVRYTIKDNLLGRKVGFFNYQGEYSTPYDSYQNFVAYQYATVDNSQNYTNVNGSLLASNIRNYTVEELTFNCSGEFNPDSSSNITVTIVSPTNQIQNIEITVASNIKSIYVGLGSLTAAYQGEFTPYSFNDMPF